MYTDIFIDFDDTLYDTYGNSCIALKELFEQFKLSQYFKTFEDFTTHYWNTNIKLWSQYAKGEITRDYLIIERFRRPLSYGHDINPTPEFCLEISDAFLALCATKSSLKEGALSLVQYIKGKGYRLHMASNGFHEVQYIKLRSCNLNQYFDTVILSEDANSNKPSSMFFNYAISKTGATLDTAIMIGDNINTDIAGAHAFGMDQIWYNPYDEPQPAEFTPTHTVKSLNDITKIL